MASITKTQNGYRAQINIKGTRDSKVFRTKREADSWAAARETELREIASKRPGERYTLRDAFQKYAAEVSTRKRGERWEIIRLAMFERLEYMPVDKMLADVTASDMAKYRDARLKAVKPASYLREMNTISNVFEVAVNEWEWISRNPTKNLHAPSKPPHRDVVIKRYQVRGMLQQMQYRTSGPVNSVSQSVAVCLLVALRTGMRAKELCSLKWPDIREGYCILHETKTDPRHVPLTPKATALIRRMEGFDPELVFGLAPQTLSTFFYRYRNRAGYTGFTFHDSRHTAATWIAARMKSSNIPAQQAVFDLCKMFGWKNINQALVYYNPSAADIAKRIT